MTTPLFQRLVRGYPMRMAGVLICLRAVVLASPACMYEETVKTRRLQHDVEVGVTGV